MQIVGWGDGEAMSDGVVDQTWIVRSLKLGAHLLPLLRRNGPEERIQNLIQFVSCTVRSHPYVLSIAPQRGMSLMADGQADANVLLRRPPQINNRTCILFIR